MGLFSHRNITVNIDKALLMIRPRNVVKRLKMTVTISDLIEAVALDLIESPDALLDEVASFLTIPVSPPLKLPALSLLESTPFDLKLLQSLGIFLYSESNSSSGYALAVSDLSKISIKEFQDLGVPVTLSLGRHIQNAWHALTTRHTAQYTNFSDEMIARVLHQIAHEAFNRGASEVFVGYPDTETYQFVANGTTYAGQLHSEAARKIESKTQEDSRVTGLHLKYEDTDLQISTVDYLHEHYKVLTWKINTHENVVATNSPENCSSEINNPKCDFPILLIEDDCRFATLLKHLLESKKYSVTVVGHGVAGLKALASEKFSLIICDVHMAVMDGISFLHKMQKSSTKIPIIMLSSDEDDLLHAQLALLGVSAVVRKSSDPRVLLAWIWNLQAGHDTASSALEMRQMYA